MNISSWFKKTVSREEIIWCYRTLHQREPESEAAIQIHAKCKSLKDLVECFVQSSEYIAKRGVPQKIMKQSLKVVPVGRVDSSSKATAK